MRRYWSPVRHVLGTEPVDKMRPKVGVNVLVEGFQGPPGPFDVLPEGFPFVRVHHVLRRVVKPCSAGVKLNARPSLGRPRERIKNAQTRHLRRDTETRGSVAALDDASCRLRPSYNSDVTLPFSLDSKWSSCKRRRNCSREGATAALLQWFQ